MQHCRAWAYSILFLTVVAGAMLSGGCAHRPSKAATSGEPQLYPARGLIREVKPAELTVIIKHDPIPDYMAAMTMPFEVKDARELDGLKPGDEVSFVVYVTEKDGWISQIAKVGTSAPYEAKPREAVRVTRVVKELEVGDLMSDYAFTNELGQAVSLGQYRGKAYAITFIYTRCPFPTFCPRTASNFAEATDLLLKMRRAPRNWHLLALTFDPDHDTPARLRAYGLQYGYNPKRWNLLTGAMVDIDAITEQFGMSFDRTGDTFSHNVRTVVVDPAGRIRKIFIGVKWTAEELATEVAKAAAIKG
jgi:protein SCO1/2